MTRLDGKVALVTGAGRGIGLALAQTLTAEGASVVVNDLDAEAADAAVSAIQGAGGVAIACAGSVSHPDFPKRFIGAAVERFGDIHVIVNNAGYIWNSPVHKMIDEQIEIVGAERVVARQGGALRRDAKQRRPFVFSQ